MYTIFRENFFGNNGDNLRHSRSVAYSAELVLLNKQQISGGEACHPVVKCGCAGLVILSV